METLTYIIGISSALGAGYAIASEDSMGTRAMILSLSIIGIATVI